LERAKDYLRALDTYYDGRQRTMAERLKVTESWLSRYLDLARIPDALLVAFPEPQELGIRNVIALKALLKPDEKRALAFAEAKRLAGQQRDSAKVLTVVETIRLLTVAADPPKRSGSPKKSGKPQTVSNADGKPVMRIEGADRKGVRLTLLHKSGATREDAEKAVREILDLHWL
jgi:ParB family chromosome partitioning protein